MLAVIFAIVVASCTPNGEIEQAIAPTAHQTKIGVLLPLSGPAAFVGNNAKNGIQLAYDSLPETQKARIDLIFEDDSCAAKQGLDAANKLVQTDKIHFLMGPVCNAVIGSTADLMKENRIVYLSLGALNSNFIGLGPHHFSLHPRTRALIERLADYSYDTKDARILAILYLDDEFGVESANYFDDRFTQRGGKITTQEKFAKGDTDFRTQLTKIMESPIDGIFIQSYGAPLIAQLKQMDELGLKTQIYGPVTTQDPVHIDGAGELADWIIYPYSYKNTGELAQTAFENGYLNRYGKEPDIYARTSFDSFNALNDALNRCGDESECVMTHLSSLTGYRGAIGSISIDADGIGLMPITINQIEAGKFVTIG